MGSFSENSDPLGSSNFFRSELMLLCNLYFHKESVFACLSELGELGLVQFNNMNPQNNVVYFEFINELQRCEKMQNQLFILKNEIVKSGIPIRALKEVPKTPSPQEMISIETMINKMVTELLEVTDNYETLMRNATELKELRSVVSESDKYFTEGGKFHDTNNIYATLVMQDEAMVDIDKNINLRNINDLHILGYYCGVLPRTKVHSFERILWRLCHGNYYLRISELEGLFDDPFSQLKNIQKNMFIIFFHGEATKTKLLKLFEAFHVTRYLCPETALDRQAMVDDVRIKLEDLNRIIQQSNDQRYRMLLYGANKYKMLMTQVLKLKGIYHILNHLEINKTRRMYCAEVWLPRVDLENIRKAIMKGNLAAESFTPPLIQIKRTKRIPPTFIRTNKFTRGFQALIDAYGIAGYRELNPAPYTIVTFPFLFAVMFGDIGHGILITLFALWMVICEKKIIAQKSKNEIWNIFFGGRYIILLMGIFSIYTGFIYNDIFAGALNIFGSQWTIHNMNLTGRIDMKQLWLEIDFDPKYDYLQTPYIFGIDPIWEMSPSNQIIMCNSFKMKLSIVLGVFQMLFGLVLSAFNHRYFKNTASIFLEFLPQLIFLVALFFYLCILIFVKWIKYSGINEPPNNISCAPSILITFIDMLLFKSDGKHVEDPKCSIYLYPGEQYLELILVCCAYGSVPVMFLGKPTYLWLKKRRTFIKPQLIAKNPKGSFQIVNLDPQISGGVPASQQAKPAQVVSSANLNQFKSTVAGPDANEEYDEMSEVVITQGIHTIESVLGSVSHTASYLRLWALSLAHNQLSLVLWDMIMTIPFRLELPATPVFVFVIFTIWAVLTISILVLMEGLSAFLHTLRLHWVEFQSKFYRGTGYKFEPFVLHK